MWRKAILSVDSSIPAHATVKVLCRVPHYIDSFSNSREYIFAMTNAVFDRWERCFQFYSSYRYNRHVGNTNSLRFPLDELLSLPTDERNVSSAIISLCEHRPSGRPFIELVHTTEDPPPAPVKSYTLGQSQINRTAMIKNEFLYMLSIDTRMSGQPTEIFSTQF